MFGKQGIPFLSEQMQMYEYERKLIIENNGVIPEPNHNISYIQDHVS